LIAIGIEADDGAKGSDKSNGGIAISAAVDDKEDVIDGDPEVDPGNEDEVTEHLNHGEFPKLAVRRFPPPPPPTVPKRVRIPIELPTDRDPPVELCDRDIDAFGL